MSDAVKFTSAEIKAGLRLTSLRGALDLLGISAGMECITLRKTYEIYDSKKVSQVFKMCQYALQEMFSNAHVKIDEHPGGNCSLYLNDELIASGILISEEAVVISRVNTRYIDYKQAQLILSTEYFLAMINLGMLLRPIIN